MEMGKNLCLASSLTRQNTGNVCETELGATVGLVEKDLSPSPRGA